MIIDTENDTIPKMPVDEYEQKVDCPLCEGQENRTPNEIYAIRSSDEANKPGWKVRVVPNIKPILKVEGELQKSGIGVYDMVSGVGANEVIVESPQHVRHFFELSEEQIELVFDTYRARIQDLHCDKRLRYILIFKNHGRLAGASTIDHPHSDLIALPATPIRVKQKLNGAREYYGYKERCLLCDIIQQEIEMADRLIFQSEYFVILAPYASRFPFELLIIPKRHSFTYKMISKEEIKDIASVSKKILRLMYDTLGEHPYNLFLNDSPNLLPQSNYWKTIKEDYHWHFELTPRIYRSTGFEIGTGFHINRFSPERVAIFLRKNL